MKLSNKTINRLKNAYGNWALVTGATSGIGKELAIKLAESGFNIVITGRREELLTTLKTTLTERFSVEIIPVTGDLSLQQDIAALLEKISHLSMGIVILNAGFGTSGKLINANIEDELNLVDLNCKTVLRMAHYFANKMKGESRKGALVFLSSIVGFQGVPNAANYAASKAYVQSLGEGMARELKPFGIHVLCAAPGPVNSGFAKRADMQMGNALEPKNIVNAILNAIGRKTTVFPGFLTKFLVFNLGLLPRWGKVRVMEKVMGGFTKHQQA